MKGKDDMSENDRIPGPPPIPAGIEAAGVEVVTVSQHAALVLQAELLAFYDLLLTSGAGVYTRFSEGIVTLDRAATR